MPNVFRNGRWEDDQTGNYLSGGYGTPQGTWVGGTWTNPQGGTFNNGQWSQSPTISGYNADQNTLAAMGNLYGAQRAQIGGLQGPRNAYFGAQQGVLNARQGLFGPEAAYRGAQGGVFNMQEIQNAQQRGYVGMAQGINTTRQAELRQLIDAQNNTGNIVQTAALQARREAYAPRYAAAGVQIQRVDLPRGGESNQPNVWANNQTEAQYLQREQGQANAGRDLQLQAAQLAVELSGTDVAQARIAAGRAGLTLDEAHSMVEQAQLGADQAHLGYQQAQAQYGDQVDYAQNDVSQARLQSQYADQPPAPGMVKYVNPMTGLEQWTTPQGRADLTQQYGESQQQQGGGGGGLSGATIADIRSYLEDDYIDTATAIQSLMRIRGMTPARAQIEVQQAIAARARRGGGGGGASGGAINWNAIMNGGNGAAPAAAPSTGQTVDGYYNNLINHLMNNEDYWQMPGAGR